MWSPTHVQVLVKRAKGLKVKGKDGTNDAFVTIGLGKEKFRTSTKEKATDPIEWMEQCELQIPTQGNTAEVQLTVLHRNLIGVDEFLGQVTLPLRDFDVYERPKTRWYELKCKPGQNKKDYRGELEVRIGFTVKASESVGGSTADLTKKNKGSLSSLNKVAGTIGGSLMSLGSKEKKNLKKLVKSAGHKVEKAGEKAKKSVSTLKLHKEKGGGGLDAVPETRQWSTLDRRGQENLDPGVNSDDEDNDMFKFDTLSQRSNASSLSINKLGHVSNSSTPFRSPSVATPEVTRAKNNISSQVPRSKDNFSRYGVSSSTVDLAAATREQENKKKTLGLKLKNSYSFKDKGDEESRSVRRNSIESNSSRHSRTLSDGSFGPPNGTRVVLGRDASPIPQGALNIPQDKLAKYADKSNVELIEMLVTMEKLLEDQTRKVGDLEDYIDGLLLRVMEVAPVLLQKDLSTSKPSIRNAGIKLYLSEQARLRLG